MYLKPNGSGDFKMKLKPESETKFFFERHHDQEIDFLLDSMGKVIKHFFINKGMKLELKRIDEQHLLLGIVFISSLYFVRLEISLIPFIIHRQLYKVL